MSKVSTPSPALLRRDLLAAAGAGLVGFGAGVTVADELNDINYKVETVITPEKFGAAGDGVTDDTTAITDMFAAAAGKTVIFSSKTYITGAQTPPANCIIVMQPGCVLKDSGVLGASDRLLNLTNDNIIIIAWRAKLEIDRSDYTTGEQRHCVHISNSSDVSVFGLGVEDVGGAGAAGDGFYLGGSGAVAVRTMLRGVWSKNCYRNGISITNARDFLIEDAFLELTNGTNPEAGLDVEPNGPTDVIRGKIARLKTLNNTGMGIEISIANLDNTSEAVELLIEDHISVGDNRGIRVQNNTVTPVSGRIVLNRPVSDSPHKSGLNIFNYTKNGPRLIAIDPHVLNPNQSAGTDINDNSAIALYNQGIAEDEGGNVAILRPVVRDDAGNLNTNVRPIVVRSGGLKWDNVDIEFPEVTGHASADPWNIDTTAKGVRLHNDLRRYRAAHTADFNVTDGRYFGRIITNEGASGTITATLPATSEATVGWRYTFLVMSAFEFRIDPNGTDLIRGGTAGQYLVSSTIGDTFTIECDAAGSWRIVEHVGTRNFV